MIHSCFRSMSQCYEPRLTDYQSYFVKTRDVSERAKIYIYLQIFESSQRIISVLDISIYFSTERDYPWPVKYHTDMWFNLKASWPDMWLLHARRIKMMLFDSRINAQTSLPWTLSTVLILEQSGHVITVPLPLDLAFLVILYVPRNKTPHSRMRNTFRVNSYNLTWFVNIFPKHLPFFLETPWVLVFLAFLLNPYILADPEECFIFFNVTEGRISVLC